MARIGVIDSGFGGLSFVKAYAEKSEQAHTIIYAGDNARAPYGILDVEVLYQFAVDLIDFLIVEYEVEAVIIACGTIATNVLGQLQSTYDIPIYGISQQLFQTEPTWREPVGVIATNKTVESRYFQDQFEKERIEASVIATQSFVDIVEKHHLIDKALIASALQGVHHCKMLILGCTHFPFLADAIQSVMPDVELVDPAHALLEVVDALPVSKKEVHYVTSGDVKAFQRFLETHNLPEGDVRHANFARFK